MAVVSGNFRVEAVPAEPGAYGRHQSQVEGNNFILDASASTDADRRIVSYDWYISSAAGR